MAGVSVQAFRRQGRRFGAGLVCSEMVSCAGLQHRNERTLGYLRIGADEHPLAVQIFGAEPDAMADAARLVEAAGADIVDINFGCPVRKVTKTGAGATLLDDPEHACRIVASVVEAVSVPVTVKMRRGRRERLARRALRRPAAGRGRRGRADAPPPLREADVHRHRRPFADGRARRPRGRPRDRLGRHRLARERGGGARADRRGRGHGRARGAGQSVDGRRDRRAQRPPPVPRGGRRRAPASSSRTPCARWARSARPGS